MRFSEIKLCNLLKSLMFFLFTLLVLFGAISIKQLHAQDIPNTEEVKAVTAKAQKRKSLKFPKINETKPKSTIAAFKNKPQPLKTVSRKNTPQTTAKASLSQSYTIIPVSENVSKAYAVTGIGGTVRLKQLDRGAAGVLIEAIRADTKEMIESAVTGAAGEFKFSKLPTGVTLIFLVSSPNTKPLIFQTAIENGMKNLDFTVLPK